MKQFKLQTGKAKAVYGCKTVLTGGATKIDFLIALDPNTLKGKPEVHLALSEETILPVSVRSAPRFFRMIKAADKGIEGASAKDCWRIRFALDLNNLPNKSKITLQIKTDAGSTKLPITLVEYEAEIARIRDKIIELTFPEKTGTSKQYRDLYRAITKMPKPIQNRLDAMETIALALGANHGKPARTFFYLNRIRKTYEQLETPEKYATFETLFAKAVAPKVLLPHGYAMTNALHATESSEVVREIEKTFAFWKSHGYDCFINSGSLLGLVRDQKFIEHDDDIDIGIILHSRKVQDVVREWVNIRDIMKSAGLISPKMDERQYQVYKFKNDLGIAFDLFAAWFNEKDQFSVYPHSFQNLERADIYPLSRDNVYGIPMPANPKKMLESNYGPNWTIPDPLSRFNWRKANNKFAQFLKELNHHVERVVITYGTFDLFHHGHVRLLKRASKMGTRLIVACSTDEFNSLKGKKSTWSFEKRAEVLRSCRYVDHVVPEHDWAQKIDDIKAYNVSVFTMGDDWLGKFDELKSECEVVYLPRTEGVSTTEIKESVRKAI